MNIRITHVLKDQNAFRVKFHSPIGNGMALLSGTIPRISDNLDVEIDLNEIFSWGRNITASSGRTPSISVANGITQITAGLIPGADEECAALQFGNSILIIELDTPIAEKTGFVDVITTKIRLYPTNI